MKELLGVITRNGQVTIPAELRRALRLRQGDQVAFALEPEGSIRVTVPHYPTVASLRGADGTLKEPLSWEEMREVAIEDYLNAEYARSDE